VAFIQSCQRAAPKVKDPFLGSDICHAFSHFYPRLEEDHKQAFEFSKLLFKEVISYRQVEKANQW
jgi:hypothetical protein